MSHHHHDATVLPTSPIRALHGLRETEAMIAETALPMLGAGWAAERLESYDGQLMLLLTRDDDEAMEFVFMLHGDAAGLRLGLMRDDEFEPIGRFDTVIAALRHIRGLMDGAYAQPIAPAAA